MSKYFVLLFALLLTTMVLWCRCSIEAMKSDTLTDRIRLELKTLGYHHPFQSEIHADTVNVLATHEDKTIGAFIIHHKKMNFSSITKDESYPHSRQIYDHSFYKGTINTL